MTRPLNGDLQKKGCFIGHLEDIMRSSRCATAAVATGAALLCHADVSRACHGGGAEWSEAAGPAQGDTAISDVPGTFTVGFDAEHSHGRLLVCRGEATFDLQGQEHGLSHSSHAFDATQVALHVGELAGDDAGLTLLNGSPFVYVRQVHLGTDADATGRLATVRSTERRGRCGRIVLAWSICCWRWGLAS